MNIYQIFQTLLFLIISLNTVNIFAEEKIVNVYTSRHYEIDKTIYKDFTKLTGIKVREISAKDQALLERIKSESSNSPADVLILADASRLWRAQEAGYFQEHKSTILKNSIPRQFRSNNTWVGLTVRARIIVFNKNRFSSKDINNYEDLANSKFKGQFCSRTSSHPYMLSLISSLINNLGENKTKLWARNIVSNQARDPKGGDTDQMRAISSGECGVALTNSYYMVRLMRSNSPKDKKVIENLGFVMPNQSSFGTHINVTGAGIVKTSPHPQNAKTFIEFLASPKVQKKFANGNNEWPVIESADITNKELISIGTFKRDTLSIALIGKTQFKAQKMADEIGWK
jgi:iron(III) transport system substrate-binding protein